MFLFYYETKKEVKLLDRRLGLMNGGVLALLLYIVGGGCGGAVVPGDELGQGQVRCGSRMTTRGARATAGSTRRTPTAGCRRARSSPTVVTTTATR